MDLYYRYDDGLEFLQYCSNKELNFFIELYKSEGKISETLSSQIQYKKHYPDHQKYWELIAAELQYFGGNTISNYSRKKGVLYKDIICDICTKENINYDKNADVAQIEKTFIYEYLAKNIENINASDGKDLKKSLNIFENDELKLLNNIRKKLFTDNNFYQIITTSLLNSLGKNILTQSLKNTIPILAGKILTKNVSYPIGIILAAKDISDPAFRVTLPCVIFIAYLRSKYKKHDLYFRRRFYPKVGSILRTSLIGGVADHSGIYIGDKKIIELTESNKKGYVEIVDLYDFVYRSLVRTGVSIYIAVDKLSKDIISDTLIAENAMKHLGCLNKYELIKNNCHSFVYKCISNKEFDKITKVWSFTDLTKGIEKIMNNGRVVQWVVCDINPLEYKKNNNWKIEDEVV